MAEGPPVNAEMFHEHRPLLFTIAYQITGSSTDAEDVLQDSYLRWADVDESELTNLRAYLSQLVTRQALNHLRARSRRREEYVGPWLPEPLRTETSGDASEDVLLAESVSMAMLVVLETLTPDERAVFVLREVFGFEHAEIAEAVGRSAPAVRQMAHRAREHVKARRRRFEPTTAAVQRISEQFLRSATTGDVQGLLTLLAPGAVLISDGGGKVSAARKPVLGAANIAAFLVGIAASPLPSMRIETAVLNGSPAIIAYSADRVDLVLLLEFADALVAAVYIVRNPDKLTAIERRHQLSL